VAVSTLRGNEGGSDSGTGSNSMPPQKVKQRVSLYHITGSNGGSLRTGTGTQGSSSGESRDLEIAKARDTDVRYIEDPEGMT